jgi:glycosyltransferase involved in cell wall biosynthesis
VPLRILLVSNAFAPAVFGGSDIAASCLGALLAEGGHQVAVFTLAGAGERPGWETDARGIRIFRCAAGHPYPYLEHERQATAAKLRWHLHDHFHVAGSRQLDVALQGFAPDVVNVHNVQGLGYRLLSRLGGRGLPVVVTLHDLGLACINMSRFRNGRQCEGWCLPCRASARIKSGFLSAIRRLAVWSPSHALLETMRPWLPAQLPLARVIRYPLVFPGPRRAGVPRDEPRLLFVGRVHPSKGIGFALELLADLAREVPFHFTVVGGGPSLAELQARFAGCSWLTFAGPVPQQQVADHLADADLLLVPSLWLENSPLVIHHALSVGVPVLGSDTGGIGELVERGSDGDLLPPGDGARWRAKLSQLLREPALLQAWRRNAEAGRGRFAPAEPLREAVALFHEAIDARVG